MIILFWLFCAFVIAAGGIYLIASIEVHREMKRAKKHDNELSFDKHDWKNFKNKPW